MRCTFLHPSLSPPSTPTSTSASASASTTSFESEVTKTFTFFAEETESGGFLFRFFFSRGPKQKSDFFRCRVFSDKFVDVGSVVWRLRRVVARKERYDGLSRLKDFLEIWVRFVNKTNDKTTLACYLMKRLFRFLLGSRQQAITTKVDY